MCYHGNVRSFTVPGTPIGKGRPRFVRETCHVYTPKRTREYEELIQWCYLKEFKEEDPFSGPVSVEVIAFFRIPKNTRKTVRPEMLSGMVRPLKKPDCDNILKAVSDALNGLAYTDDKQIVKASVEKWYAEEERVEVIIRKI